LPGRRKTHYYYRFIWVGVLTCILALEPSGFSHGQLQANIQPSSLAQLPLPNLNLNQLETQLLPPEVRQIGGAEIAPVHFQGKLLLEVASPSVIDRENPGETLPVEIRAKRIEDNLDYVVSFVNPDLMPKNRGYRTVYDPDSFNVQVDILNGQTVVTARDDTRDASQVLATVTATDAEYYGLSQQEVGELWRDRIQTALGEALQARSPPG